MVLAGTVGLVLQRVFDVSGAFAPALLLGLVVAMFLPARRACTAGIPPHPRPGPGPGSGR